MPELQMNFFEGLGIGSLGMGLLILFISIVIIGMVGAGIYFYLQRKQLKYIIPLLRKVGNRVIRVGVYKAKDYKISRAGDKLWYIPKLKKYLGVGTIQTAPNEYTHFEREDGEWINVGHGDIDVEMKEVGVRYVDQDMRSQRIAISNILEQRFKGKQSFWEKYGHLITLVIFYFVIAVAMVVIFYQWSDIVDRTGILLDRIIEYEQLKCSEVNSIVPA